MEPVLVDYCRDCGEELYFTVVTFKPFVASARCCACCKTRWAEDAAGATYGNVLFMAHRAGIEVSNYTE